MKPIEFVLAVAKALKMPEAFIAMSVCLALNGTRSLDNNAGKASFFNRRAKISVGLPLSWIA